MFGGKKRINPWPMPITKKQVLHSFDPLAEIDQAMNIVIPAKFRQMAEKPSKFPKKIRSSPRESYYPMHGGRK